MASGSAGSVARMVTLMLPSNSDLGMGQASFFSDLPPRWAVAAACWLPARCGNVPLRSQRSVTSLGNLRPVRLSQAGTNFTMRILLGSVWVDGFPTAWGGRHQGGNRSGRLRNKPVRVDRVQRVRSGPRDRSVTDHRGHRMPQNPQPCDTARHVERLPLLRRRKQRTGHATNTHRRVTIRTHRRHTHIRVNVTSRVLKVTLNHRTLIRRHNQHVGERATGRIDQVGPEPGGLHDGLHRRQMGSHRSLPIRSVSALTKRGSSSSTAPCGSGTPPPPFDVPKYAIFANEPAPPFSGPISASTEPPPNALLPPMS